MDKPTDSLDLASCVNDLVDVGFKIVVSYQYSPAKVDVVHALQNDHLYLLGGSLYNY